MIKEINNLTRVTIVHVLRRVFWLALIILLIWSLGPLLWAIPATFKTYSELFRLPPKILPDNYSFVNYGRVLEFPMFWRIVYNSSVITMSSTILTLFLTILAGYGFSRHEFKFKSLLLMCIFIPRIIPRVSLIIPLFRVYAHLGLLNSHLGLIIAYSASSIPLAVWVITGFFKTIPLSLEESALVDGAKKWQVLWSIILPLSKPALITIAVFAIREGWNEFGFALAFNSQSYMRTLPVQLSMLKDGLKLEDWPLILSFTFFAISPLLVLYFIFQRTVVQGIVSGAVKE